MDVVHTLLMMLLVFGVTEGTKAIFANFGKDISGSASAIVAAVWSIIILAVDPLLAQIPATYGPYVNAIANFLVVLLSAFGVQRTAVRFAGHFGVGKSAVK